MFGPIWLPINECGPPPLQRSTMSRVIMFQILTVQVLIWGAGGLSARTVGLRSTLWAC